jgi:general secretion pathway protein A
MVLRYYNLREQPFGVEPDPRFLLMSRTHREALASLTYGLQEERGFMALAARPGMGKTTLIFHLLEQLRDRARTVFLFQTQCDPGQFLRYLLGDLGLTPSTDLVTNHEKLNQLLVEEARAGRRLVLIVDEAQGLQPPVLETIRLLSDFETPGRKLFQIILAGQLGLVETLLRSDLEQLRQRVSFVASLQPFGHDEVVSYIHHRLEVAGFEGRRLFTDQALRLISDSSEGIPRNINQFCFHALSAGYALNQKEIGKDVIEEVLVDRNIESLLPAKSASIRPSTSKPVFGQTALLPPQSRFRGAIVGGFALAASGVAFAALGLGPIHLPRSILHLARQNKGAITVKLPRSVAPPTAPNNEGNPQ